MRPFTDIELQRWCESGPGQDRERVVAHLAECAACASHYAKAIRRHPLTADADNASVIYATETGSPPWTMPVDVRERFRSGSAYWWTVTALDGTGAPVTWSARRPFTLAGP